MALSGSNEVTFVANGLTIHGGSAALSATMAIESLDVTLPVGHAGVLTTRDGDGEGHITLTAGHDIVTGDVDIHWAGGCRYAMAGTVSTNALAVIDDAGSGGTVLPAQDTAVVVAPRVSYDVTFDGDNVVGIGVSASRQTSFRFCDTSGAVLCALFIVAGGAWSWDNTQGTTRPITGNAVVTVVASCGDATYTSNVKMAGLQY